MNQYRKKILSLLSLAAILTTQGPLMGMEELIRNESQRIKKGGKSSFAQRLKKTLDHYNNDEERLLVKMTSLFAQKNNLKTNLATNIAFNNDELNKLFDISKKLGWAIIVAKNNNNEISQFSIYKGNSIANVTEIQENGSSLPHTEKIKEFFISSHFLNLEEIDLAHNNIKKIHLPHEKLQKLRRLDLSHNRLRQFTRSLHAPMLEFLDLEYNKLTKVRLHNIPMLKILHAENNVLTHFQLSRSDSLRALTLDPIPSVTAFYRNTKQTFKNQSDNTILRYIKTGEFIAGDYAQGVDIHTDDRDEKMKEFAKAFKDIKFKKINSVKKNERNFQHFKRYLEKLEQQSAKSKQLVQQAKFTLGLPVEEPNNFDEIKGFGPLLNSDDNYAQTTVYGLNMTRKQLVNRFLYFVLTYKNSHNLTIEGIKKERENAKYALVASLAEAVQEVVGKNKNKYKNRVCDEGKIQRLFAGVLQGRLERINVDDLTPEQLQESKPTVSQAFEIFKAAIDHKFKEKSWNILYDPTKLRKEVKKFLKDNVSVDAKEFRDWIEEFINDPYYGF